MCDEFYQNLDDGKLNGVVFLDIRKNNINNNINNNYNNNNNNNL